MIFSLFSELTALGDTTSVLLLAILAYLTWKFFHNRGLPPGPPGLPFLGYIPFLGTKPVEVTFLNLSKKYGEVVSLYFGSKLFIVLNSYDSMKEALVKQGANFSGRANDLSPIRDFNNGIVVSEGELWKDHRRFILSTFREYGMGTLSLEPRIMEEVNAYLEAMADHNGKPFDVTHLLGMSTQNIISILEFGKRFDYEDEKFIRLRKLQTDLFAGVTIFPIHIFFPFINYLPFSEVITHQKLMDKNYHAMITFMKDLFNEHKADYQENDREDLIKAYITEQREQIRKSGDEGFFYDTEIIATLFTLFLAGAEPISAVLQWAYLMMMIYPEIQKKVQKEIDDVVGMERRPSINDRSRMTYTEAVLLETLRFGSITPVNQPHSNFEETELYGYRIPKRSVVIANLWAVHFDPKLWDHPELFKPERFINKDGKLQSSEHIVSFGIGKRGCLGESLARMEEFLYFAGTLQRFDLRPPSGKTAKIEFDPKKGRFLKPYEFCAIQRKCYCVS